MTLTGVCHIDDQEKLHRILCILNCEGISVVMDEAMSNLWGGYTISSGAVDIVVKIRDYAVAHNLKSVRAFINGDMVALSTPIGHVAEEESVRNNKKRAAESETVPRAPKKAAIHVFEEKLGDTECINEWNNRFQIVSLHAAVLGLVLHRLDRLGAEGGIRHFLLADSATSVVNRLVELASKRDKFALDVVIQGAFLFVGTEADYKKNHFEVSATDRLVAATAVGRVFGATAEELCQMKKDNAWWIGVVDRLVATAHLADVKVQVVDQLDNKWVDSNMHMSEPYPNLCDQLRRASLTREGRPLQVCLFGGVLHVGAEADSE